MNMTWNPFQKVCITLLKQETHRHTYQCTFSLYYKCECSWQNMVYSHNASTFTSPMSKRTFMTQPSRDIQSVCFYKMCESTAFQRNILTVCSVDYPMFLTCTQHTSPTTRLHSPLWCSSLFDELLMSHLFNPNTTLFFFWWITVYPFAHCFLVDEGNLIVKTELRRQHTVTVLFTKKYFQPVNFWHFCLY